MTVAEQQDRPAEVQSPEECHVGAILAWLPPRLHLEEIRRLQLAAHNHAGVFFVVRDTSVRDSPSATPLRLEIAPVRGHQTYISALITGRAAMFRGHYEARRRDRRWIVCDHVGQRHR